MIIKSLSLCSTRHPGFPRQNPPKTSLLLYPLTVSDLFFDNNKRKAAKNWQDGRYSAFLPKGGGL